MAVEFRFDPGFVEEAVFLQAAHPADARARQMAAGFHQEREAAYGLTDAAHREATFQQLARRYFQALGLERCVTDRFDELPLVRASIELAVIRRVWNRKDEQVELYTGGAPEAAPGWVVSRTVFLGMQPARVLDRERFIAYLRHELTHVADMLDPGFAYDPHPMLAGGSQVEDDLVRERFRVLWDCWVHGRLRRRGWPTLVDDAARQRDLGRTFGFVSKEEQASVFASACGQDHWTQAQLLALARDERLTMLQLA